MDKISPIFGEFISTEKIKRSSGDGSFKSKHLRFYLIPVAIFLSISIILLRLFFIQVVEGSYYRDLADTNRIKTIIVHSPRGVIFDRNRKPLVFNVPGFRQISNGKTNLVSADDAIELIAKGAKDLEIDSLRLYPNKESMAHVLGYLGQVSEEELATSEFSSYKAGDVIGKIGIEREYEEFLKGVDGRQLAEINSQGEVIRKLGETDPIPGRDIVLTIDVDLQKRAYNAMSKIKKGAVIATTPTGEVLALISKPSFDPNLFTQGKNYKTSLSSEYKSIDEVIIDASNQPFLNRAISGTYPPGSTFKLITSAAGLENKIIDENYIVKDTGVVKIGEFSFANWYFTNYGRTDGDVNVVTGIKRSNDIFFYKLAEKIGHEKISKMARDFFIDRQYGIDLPGESVGNVPTDAWKRKYINEPWYLGDTYHYGIGQGYLLTTPLAVNSWTQAIAADGDLYRPHLLMNLGKKILNEKIISKNTIDPIRQGMIESCAPTGVAYPFFEFNVKNKDLKIDGRNILEVKEASVSGNLGDYRKIIVACKTGTAQHGGEETLPHSWITLFAPAYDPQIVLTVLAEESGEGSQIAAPIAREILEEWFSK